jgi:hypothetical protein
VCVCVCHRNAGQIHNIKATYKYLKNVTNVIDMGPSVMHHSYIYEKVKSRLNSGNACSHTFTVYRK